LAKREPKAPSKPLPEPEPKGEVVDLMGALRERIQAEEPAPPKPRTGKRRQAHNEVDPARRLSADAPPDVLKAEFGRRLQRALADKGWNQSEFARRAMAHAVEGVVVDRDKISKYVNGKHLPAPPVVDALAKTLGIDPADLLPRGVQSAGRRNPPFEATQTDEDGLVWLRVNQAVTWGAAVKIKDILDNDHG
jgi:transcriptional regulator with XRE-family HTH domain